MSHISKKFSEALKEIKLEAGQQQQSPQQANPADFGSIWKWVAILVFVIVVALIIVVLMRDTQAKNVVLEQVAPRKRKRVSFEKEEEEEANEDPNFTLLSVLMKQQQTATSQPPT